MEVVQTHEMAVDPNHGMALVAMRESEVVQRREMEVVESCEVRDARMVLAPEKRESDEGRLLQELVSSRYWETEL